MKKRQRRLTEVDEIVLSRYAKGMTTGEISAHFAEIYDASVCGGLDDPVGVFGAGVGSAGVQEREDLRPPGFDGGGKPA